MKKFSVVPLIILCLWQSAQAASNNEFTVRAFVTTLISLELSEYAKHTLRDSDTSTFNEIITNLEYLKGESKRPMQRLFSDLKTPAPRQVYALLSARQAIDSMTGSLIRPWSALSERIMPTFDEEIKNIELNNRLNKDEVRQTCLALADDENTLLKKWLETFKQKQASGEVSTSEDDLHREVDAFFQEGIDKITQERASTQSIISQVMQGLNGDNADDNTLPSLTDYFSASK